MFLALAQLTNKAFTDAGKGRIRQSLTALVWDVSTQFHGYETSRDIWCMAVYLYQKRDIYAAA